MLTILKNRDIIILVNLGIAQMVARYLGVVEAVGSNPATQTKTHFCLTAEMRFYIAYNI